VSSTLWPKELPNLRARGRVPQPGGPREREKEFLGGRRGEGEAGEYM
jgi:hypothetical protein